MDQVARLEIRQRGELFQEIARLRGDLSSAILEKDFWVCWTLKRLFELARSPAGLVFKGGTSLSKVFGVIERFSEDIDLSLDRSDLGFTGERDPYTASSKRQRKRLIDEVVTSCRRAIAEQLLPALHDDFEGVLGPDQTRDGSWLLSLSDDDRDGQTVLFSYPAGAAVGAPAYIRPIVRIELGARADLVPNALAEIEPLAATTFPEAFAAPRCLVRVLAAERTFWEKATLLHCEYHRPDDRAGKERTSRHYYDLFRLYRNPIGDRALASPDLLDAVVRHKSLFFATTFANYAASLNGGLRLVPPDHRRDVLKRDYEKMKEMIFGDSPPLGEIVETLLELEERVNAARQPKRVRVR
jgi:hypothetical protein